VNVSVSIDLHDVSDLALEREEIEIAYVILEFVPSSDIFHAIPPVDC